MFHAKKQDAPYSPMVKFGLIMSTLRFVNLPLPVVAFFVGAFATTGRCLADEPTARGLYGLHRRVSDSESDCRSIDVSGFIGGDGGCYRFRALYKAPDKYSFLISDSIDGTPLAISCGRQTLLYDAEQGFLYHSNNSSTGLEMRCKDREFGCSTRILFSSGHRSEIDIDLGPILTEEFWLNKFNPVQARIAKLHKNTYKLGILTSPESRFDSTFELGKDFPCESVSFSINGHPFLGLDRIVVNKILEDDLFVLPAPRTWARIPPVKELADQADLAESKKLTALASRSLVVRTFLNFPESHNSQKLKPTGIDWECAKSNDKKYSKALKALIPLGLQNR